MKPLVGVGLRDGDVVLVPEIPEDYDPMTFLRVSGAVRDAAEGINHVCLRYVVRFRWSWRWPWRRVIRWTCPDCGVTYQAERSRASSR